MRYLWMTGLLCVMVGTAGAAEADRSTKPVLGSAAVLNTVTKATVRSKPSTTARALGTLPANTRLKAIAQKDFWFQVTCELNGRETTGWVYFTEVTQTLGMSKGQLMELNRALGLELTKLREAVEEKDIQIAALRAQVVEMAERAEAMRKELEAARQALETARSKRPAPVEKE